MPLCLITVLSKIVKLLCNIAEPESWLLLMGCLVAERGVLVKDGAKLAIEISD